MFLERRSRYILSRHPELLWQCLNTFWVKLLPIRRGAFIFFYNQPLSALMVFIAIRSVMRNFLPSRQHPTYILWLREIKFPWPEFNFQRGYNLETLEPLLDSLSGVSFY
jgi:hypothetical protein